MKRPNFESMGLFQLMYFAETNNYDYDYCPFVDDLPDYNPFQDRPENYPGTDEQWQKELDEFEDVIKKEYVEICKKIYIALLDQNRLE